MMMQVAGAGPNFGRIRKNTIEDSTYDPLVGWKPKKIHYVISGNPIQRSIFFLQKIHMKDHMQDHMKG